MFVWAQDRTISEPLNLSLFLFQLVSLYVFLNNICPNFVKQLLNVNPVCSAYLVNLWYCARSGASTVVLTNASASWAAAGWLRDYKETEAAALCMKPRYSVRQKEPGPTRRLNWSTRDEDPLLPRWWAEVRRNCHGGDNHSQWIQCSFPCRNVHCWSTSVSWSARTDPSRPCYLPSVHSSCQSRCPETSCWAHRTGPHRSPGSCRTRGCGWIPSRSSCCTWASAPGTCAWNPWVSFWRSLPQTWTH